MRFRSPKLLIVALAAIGLSLTAQPAKAGYINLTIDGATDTINGAVFTQGTIGSGTGVFPSFVRVHASSTEHAYNTTAHNVLDNTNDDPHNHEVLISNLAVVTHNGNNYFQFRLDIDESNGQGKEFLSLDALQIYSSATPNQSTPTVSSLGTLQYDTGAGNGVLMNYDLEPGNGFADLTVLIPVFTPAAGEQYLYLYSSFGALGTLGAGNIYGAPAGKYGSDASFEEWSFTSGTNTVAPAPAGLILFATALPIFALRRLIRRKPIAA